MAIQINKRLEAADRRLAQFDKRYGQLSTILYSKGLDASGDWRIGAWEEVPIFDASYSSDLEVERGWQFKIAKTWMEQTAWQSRLFAVPVSGLGNGLAGDNGCPGYGAGPVYACSVATGSEQPASANLILAHYSELSTKDDQTYYSATFQTIFVLAKITFQLPGAYSIDIQTLNSVSAKTPFVVWAWFEGGAEILEQFESGVDVSETVLGGRILYPAIIPATLQSGERGALEVNGKHVGEFRLGNLLTADRLMYVGQKISGTVKIIGGTNA